MDLRKLFLKRIYAAIIDMLVVVVPFVMIYYIHLSTIGGPISYGYFFVEYRILYFLSLIVYFFLCEMFGGSVGKKIMGIQIIYNKRAGLSKFLRPVFKIISFNFPILVFSSLFIKNYLLFYDLILKNEVAVKKIERKDLRG